MPKSTFYRISEEKQNRIVDAARREFLSVPYSEVSINKIIKQADIPRGSFYQYFDGKEDMFKLVLQESKQKLFQILMGEIEECNSDLFWSVENHVDRVLEFIPNDHSGKMQMLFSEPWVFEILLMALMQEKVHRGNETFGLLDKIDRSILNVENEEELTMLVSIL